MAYYRTSKRFAAPKTADGADISSDPFRMHRLLVVPGNDQTANDLLLFRAVAWARRHEGQPFLLDASALEPEVRPLLHSWEALSRPCAPSAFVVEEDLPEEIAHAVIALDAALVMLPRQRVLGGAPQSYVERLAIALVRRTARPCMVVASPQPSGAILAATDLSDPLFPVVRYAKAIAAQPETPVTLLHNMDAPPLGQLLAGSVRPSTLLAMTSAEGLAQQIHDKLKYVAASLDLRADTLVTSETETAASILAAAEQCQADLIVTGTHRDCPSRLVPRCSIAEAIIRRAACSVLVVPLGLPINEVLWSVRKRDASACKQTHRGQFGSSSKP